MRAAKTKTDIRQEQIAVAALDLMARHGPKSLSVAGLARKVGVVPSAIYRHYAGKDAVVDAMLDLIALRLQENVQSVRRETPDALERLRRLLTRHVQLIQANVAIPRIVFSEEVFDGNRQRRERVHNLIQTYLDAVAELIREGQRLGRLRAEVPADTAAILFLGIIHPAVILWLTSDAAFDFAAHAEKSWRLFSNLLDGQANGPAARVEFPDDNRPASKSKKNRNTQQP